MPDHPPTTHLDLLETLPPDLIREAADAAAAVLARRLDLMAPNRVFLDEAVTAAAEVVIDPLRTRHEHLRAALKDVVITSCTTDVPADDRLKTIKKYAVAALRADLP